MVRTPGGYSTERTVAGVRVILSRTRGSTWDARDAATGQPLGSVKGDPLGGWNVRDKCGKTVTSDAANLDEACRALVEVAV
jgi:hypothetical protein